jgi:hypothetical protein
LGFGSGMTCWRRLRDWERGRGLAALARGAAGRAADLLGFSRAAVDVPHLRAMKGGKKNGRSPVDRGRTGSNHHVIVEAHGVPLAATLTGGNRSDVTELIPLIQAVPPIEGTRGRPRRRPDTVYADRGYGHDKYRRLMREQLMVYQIRRP